MWNKRGFALLLCLSLCLALCACGAGGARERDAQALSLGEIERENFLSIIGEDADTVDPQCTSEYYLIALNVFDRLVEVRVNGDGSSEISPSLAESWTVSEDGTRYSFRLRENVSFSNGSALTASDVLYTFTRLLTHPDSCNQDIALSIEGAQALREGRAEALTGFRIHNDHEFTITLQQPYAAFLACLSTPGASILDEQTTRQAGERFGSTAEYTIGTGPFLFRQWRPGVEMLLVANRTCWSGAPKCAGIAVQLIEDAESQRLLFESGGLDILDLDVMGSEAEYFVHGDIYQARLRHGPRVGITYLALNAARGPLSDARVRRALQYALDRRTLLNTSYSGRGALENGIFPRGLIGHNPDLPEIPFDPARARDLLAQAGWADGFDLELSVTAGSSQTTLELLELVAHMWEKIGVRAVVREYEEEQYMALRRAGRLACYCSTWSADFNDPDNFIYTFFGSVENTTSRSLCYGNQAVLARVRAARGIVDPAERLREYQALEKKIIQDDAAWVPLFSREHYFVVADRVEGFQVSWNGWSNTNYRSVSLESKK